MYIDKIKKEIESHIGEKASIKCNLGRNKFEEYDVIIKKTYNHVFIVKLVDREEIRSFSYIDVMTKIIKISYLLANKTNL